MAAQGRNFDNTYHSNSIKSSTFTVKDSDRDCVNGTKNHHDNNASREGSTEFLVKYRNRDYDIFNFLRYHPGGKDKLLCLKNQNLDKELARNPHSKSAYYLLEDFAVQHQERYNELENLVNWNEPLLRQVGYMGDRYWEWVNLPTTRPIRFFQSEILELLTVTPWYILPIIWIPIIMCFLYAGCVSNISTNTVLINIIPSFVLGLLIWTSLEYFVHRKIFHSKPPDDSKWLITLHFILHGNHHKAPLDERRLAFPPIVSLVVNLLIWQIYKAIFPLTMAYFVFTGTVIGYLCYDLTHYYLHHGAPTAGSYMYTMKRRHNYHHFLHHDQGFGVTNELWDQILKTDLNLRKLNEPLKW